MEDKNTPEVAPRKVITCGRRAETFGVAMNEKDADHIRDDGTCSYCGSLDPDILMARIEAGTIILEGSDKNYKVYLKVPEGAEMLKQSHRIDDDRTGDRSKWVWQTDDVNHGKFYFQHLSDEQKKRFVDLWNERKIQNSMYVMPFFMVRTS